MVRSEDPPGAIKHLRFGSNSPDLVTALETFSGIKCIVLHTHGKKGEHPHLHVWYEGDEVTNQTVRNRLKKHNDSIFGQCKNQNDWSMRNHDSWETWAAYVCKNLTHRVLLSYRDIETVSEAAQQCPIVAEGPLHNNPPPAIVIKKNLPMRTRFINHLEHEKGWIKGERNPTPEEVIKAAIHYWEAAFTNPEGIRMCRYALYVFSDYETNEKQANRLVQKIMYDL